MKDKQSLIEILDIIDIYVREVPEEKKNGAGKNIEIMTAMSQRWWKTLTYTSKKTNDKWEKDKDSHRETHHGFPAESQK